MATIRLPLDVSSAIPDNTAGAQFGVTASGPYQKYLAFDGASTDEIVYFQTRIPNYGSGNLTLSIYWNAASATSANVVWGAAIAAVTPDADSGALSSKTFATANTVQDTHLGTNASRPMTCSITISNLDSLASQDLVWIKVYRVASDTTNDTLAGDAQILSLELSYSDT